MLPRKEYVTAKEVADHFNVGIRTVYRMITDGTLEAVPLRSKQRTLYRIRRDSVEALERAGNAVS